MRDPFQLHVQAKWREMARDCSLTSSRLQQQIYGMIKELGLEVLVADLKDKVTAHVVTAKDLAHQGIDLALISDADFHVTNLRRILALPLHVEDILGTNLAITSLGGEETIEFNTTNEESGNDTNTTQTEPVFHVGETLEEMILLREIATITRVFKENYKEMGRIQSILKGHLQDYHQALTSTREEFSDKVTSWAVEGLSMALTSDADFKVTNLLQILSLPLHGEDILGTSLAIASLGGGGDIIHFNTTKGESDNHTHNNQSEPIAQDGGASNAMLLIRVSMAINRILKENYKEMGRLQSILKGHFKDDYQELERVRKLLIAKAQRILNEKILAKASYIEVDRIKSILKAHLLLHTERLALEPDFNVTNLRALLSLPFHTEDVTGSCLALNVVFNSTSLEQEGVIPQHSCNLTLNESASAPTEHNHSQAAPRTPATNLTLKASAPVTAEHNHSQTATPQTPATRPRMLSEKYLFFHWVERTSGVVVILILLHTLWLIFRFPKYRQRLFPDQERQPLLIHCPSPSSSSTTSPFPMSPSRANFHGNGTAFSHELEELYRRKQEECLVLTRKLNDAMEELQRQPLGQSSAATAENHILRVQQLNSDLQELLQGKDLQLLDFSTQVQLLTNDLMGRESQLSSLLSLYSDQKQELEKVKVEAAQEQENAREEHAMKLDEIKGSLKRSQEVSASLSKRLGEVSDELAKYQGVERKLQEQLNVQTSKCHELENELALREIAHSKIQVELETEVRKSDDLMDQLKNQLESQEKIQAQLEDHLAPTLEQPSVAENRLRARLTAQTEKCYQLKYELQLQKNEHTKLQETLDGQVKACTELAKKLQKSEEDHQEAVRELENRSIELLDKLDLQLGRCKELEWELRQKEESHQRSESQFESRSSALQELLGIQMERRKELEEGFLHLQEKDRLREIEFQRRDGEYTALKQEMGIQIGRCKDLTEKLQLQAQEQNEKQEKLQAQLEHNALHCQDLEERLRREQDNCSELKLELANKIGLCSQLEEKCSLAQQQNEEQKKLQEELVKANLVCADLEKKLQMEQASCKQMEAEIWQIQQQGSRHEARLQEGLESEIKQCCLVREQLRQVEEMKNKTQEQLNVQIRLCKELEEQYRHQELATGELQEQLNTQMERVCQQEAAYRDLERQMANQRRELEETFEKSLLQPAAFVLPNNGAIGDMVGEVRIAGNLTAEDECNLLRKQVEQQRKLHAKQQKRNQILLDTNQALSEMLDERQHRCADLEQTMTTLSKRLEKYQRQGEVANKLEELRILCQEKQAKTQALLSTQARHAQEDNRKGCQT